MKKLFVAAAILGMTSFAIGQQAAGSKDSKDSKACTKSCSDKKCCKKEGTCDKSSKTCKPSSSSTATTTKSDKK